MWRPSENVVHGWEQHRCSTKIASSSSKEKGRHFPNNYDSIGAIEFAEDGIEAKTADLLKELIGFNLIAITPVV